MNQRVRQLAVNVGVLLATLALLTAAMEVFLRASFIQPMGARQVRLHRPSDIEGLVYELLPDVRTRGFGRETITTNSQGFRSPERDPAKPLIAVVGDSYTFGHGVEDHQTNPANLQRQFPEAYVLNAGVDGYNIEQQAIVVRERVMPLKPALLIVEFVFNDAQPKGVVYPDGTIQVGHIRTPEENDALVKQAITRKGLLNFPGKLFLQKYSAIFVFLERTTKGLPFRKKIPDTADTFTAQDVAFYERWFAQLSDAAGDTPRLFVIWPESNWHTESRAALRRMAAGRGFTVVDLYDDLGNGYRHLGWDYHPHPSVHERVAGILARTVREQNLLPLP